MTARPRALHLSILIGCGLMWGSTQTLGKIAVSTGYGHFGLIFWQAAIGAAVMGAIVALRGSVPRPTPARLRFALVVAILGTVVPGSTFYIAVSHLPAGIMSLVIATVPMLAFPVAMALGMDRFGIARLLGLACGLAGVALIALPGTALPSQVAAGWVLVALVGPLFYACEGNYVARWGTAGMDPVQAMFLASVTAAVLALPLALASGQFIAPLPPFGAAEAAIVAGAVVNVLAYAAYVWLAAQAGAVFAAQTSYIVTGTGVLWAMWLLGEDYSGHVWAAFALMLAGLALVQPRSRPAGEVLT